MKKQNLFMIGLATLLASATQAYSQEQLAKSIQEARAETARTSLQLKQHWAPSTGSPKRPRATSGPPTTPSPRK